MREKDRRRKGNILFILFSFSFSSSVVSCVLFWVVLFCIFFLQRYLIVFSASSFLSEQPPPSLSPSLLQQVENQLRLITGLRLSCVCYFLFPLVCWGFVWGFITFHLTFFCCNFRFQDFLKLLWFLFFEGACGRWRGSLPTLLLMALLRLRL